MKTSETVKQVSDALVLASGEISNPVRDSVNPYFNSKYASLDGMLDRIRATLETHGLCVVQGQDVETTSHVIIETRIIHKSGEYIETYCSAKPKNTDPQSIGSAITYCRRYGLMSALNIAGGDDDDGNTCSGDQRQTSKQWKQDRPVSSINDDTKKELARVASQIGQFDPADKTRLIKDLNASFGTVCGPDVTAENATQADGEKVLQSMLETSKRIAAAMGNGRK
jgi:hypothetical protein